MPDETMEVRYDADGYEVVNPEHTSVITLSSDDDFSKTMFLNYEKSGQTISLVYAGATLEEFAQTITR